MAASFDGTASTLETPFDNVTSESHAAAAVQSQISKIPPQQTQWDTSNIVSGPSLTPSMVGGGFPETFRSDQIPWSTGSSTWLPILAPLISTSTAAQPTYVAASNVYGGLSNAYLDTSHLFGNIPAPTVFGALTNATIDYASVTNPPSTGAITNTTQSISFFNVNQPNYYSSNYLNDEYQVNFLYQTHTIAPPTGYGFMNAVVNYTSNVGVADMVHEYVNYSSVKILQNTGIEADKLIGRIALEALPHFLTPIISYDVTSTSSVEQGNNITLQDPITPAGAQTFEMDAEIRRLYGPSFATDEMITDSINSQIATVAGYRGTTYPPITDFTDLTSLTVYNIRHRTVTTSNMRYSLAGLKNFQSDTITSSNAIVVGNLSAATITCGGVSLGGSSGSSGGAGGAADTAMSVLGMLFGAAGAATGAAAYFGGKAVGTAGVPGVPGPVGPPGPAGIAGPLPTLRELLDAVDAAAYFAERVNALIDDYQGGPGITQNILQYILNCLDPDAYQLNIPDHALRVIPKLMQEIIARSANAAGLQLVNNAANIIPPPVDPLAVVDRGLAYILPNLDPPFPV